MEEETAFNAALDEFGRLPIYLYARPMDQGGTGDLATALGWARLDCETRGVKLVVIDNLQSYREQGQTDYELMNWVVPPVTSLQSDYGLALFIISQESAEGNVRGSPIDLPAVVNNEVKMWCDEIPEGVRPDFMTVHLKVILSRFRASGQVSTLRLHAPTGLILRS